MTAVGYMPNLTLLQALNLGGGGFLKLARQGVAALLNTCGLSGHYQYTSNQVITSIHNAVIAHTAEPLASQLGSANETLPDNCPPGGRATHPALRYGIIADDNVTISSYPNPFSTKTTIEFTFVENTEGVTVDVYSLKGEKVAVLFQGNAEANKTYQLEFNADKLVDGVYIYKVSTHDNLYYSKLILIK